MLRGSEPFVSYGADFGKEESVSIEGQDKAAVTKSLQELIKKGDSLPR